MFDVERWFLHSLADNVTVYVPLYVSYLLLTIEELRGFDHVNSWVQAMPLAAAWFESVS